MFDIAVDHFGALNRRGLLLNEGRGEVIKTIANQVRHVEKSIARIVPKRSLFFAQV